MLQTTAQAPARTRQPAQRPRRHGDAAGVLLVAGGAVVILGVVTAEAFYPPGYSTRLHSLSTLAASEPPHSVTYQPSAAIFTATMLASGIVISVAALLMSRAGWPRRVNLPLGLLGVGCVGVGAFPGNDRHITPHTASAVAAYVGGGLAALLAARLLPVPLSVLSRVLGVMALGSLVAGTVFVHTSAIQRLGEGGIQRWLVYSIVAWLLMTGGFLAGHGRPAAARRSP